MLVVILLITKYVKGFFGNIAVLLGLMIGSIAPAFWQGDFAGLEEAKWVDLIYPF